MDPQSILLGAQEALTARRVFGDPIQADGVIVIPAATIGGGGGGGKGKNAEDGGVGFGLRARPAGVFVVRDGDVRWRPAIDVNRVILGGQIVAITAILVIGPAIRRLVANRESRVGSR
jgi:uncharacterized spore protein YtfJ